MPQESKEQHELEAMIAVHVCKRVRLWSR